MNENLPTNVQLDTNQNGSVTFATDVIATIAALAANEVEGVASMTGSSTSSFADILGRRGQASRNLTKGIKVDVQDGKVLVNVGIIIDYGNPIPEVAGNIQENVKKAVETMSGLTVASVDVHVQGMSFERENRATQEIEMKQRILLQKDSSDPKETAAPQDVAGSKDDPSLEPDAQPIGEADDEADQDWPDEE